MVDSGGVRGWFLLFIATDGYFFGIFFCSVVSLTVTC